MICVTLLLCNASASCSAPAVPISLTARLRALSVYIDNSSVYALDQKIIYLTVFLCSARARSPAPSGPIRVPRRSRVVSVYNEE